MGRKVSQNVSRGKIGLIFVLCASVWCDVLQGKSYIRIVMKYILRSMILEYIQ